MNIKILTKEEIVAQGGVIFETNLYYGEIDGCRIITFDKNNNEILFTGLAYDLYDNGNLEGYLFVENGTKHGLMVKFYKNGQIEFIGSLNKDSAEGYRISYYENGQKKEEGNYIVGLAMTYIKYDKNGHIIEEKKNPTESDLTYAKTFYPTMTYEQLTHK